MSESRKHQKAREQHGPPSYYKIVKHERPFQGRLFTLDRIELEFSTYENPSAKHPPVTREITRRGDAVAALLFDRQQRAVILVEQFRPAISPPMRRRIAKGEEFRPEEPVEQEAPQVWLLETVAGTLSDPNMSPETCLRTEILDEAGYTVTQVKEIGRYYASPGGSSEMIYLYYAEVSNLQRTPDKGGGDRTEDIDVITIPVEEFFQRLDKREFLDAKIIIAGYWLRDNLPLMRSSEVAEVDQPAPYTIAGTSQKIGIRIGSITDIKGIQVWVNPENTHMQMDRYFGRSVSAAIRWAGAKKIPRPRYEEDRRRDIVDIDYIADDLERQLGGRKHVELTEVIKTTSGELKATNGVDCIMHVAIAEGFFEQGLTTTVDRLGQCVDRVLATIEHSNWNIGAMLTKTYRSVLIPMLGTGANGIPVREAAPRIVERAVEFFKQKPKSRLQEIYFNAYAEPDRVILMKVLETLAEKGVLVRPAKT